MQCSIIKDLFQEGTEINLSPLEWYQSGQHLYNTCSNKYKFPCEVESSDKYQVNDLSYAVFSLRYFVWYLYFVSGIQII